MTNILVKMTKKQVILMRGLHEREICHPRQNKEQVLSCLSGQVEEGDVILMHDGYRSSVDAAFALVDHLQKQGFVFVNVEEMVLE